MSYEQLYRELEKAKMEIKKLRSHIGFLEHVFKNSKESYIPKETHYVVMEKG